MTDITDRKRLRQVATSELSQSRLNDDFVFWMKTKGMNWLLVILVVACGVMFWNVWKQKREHARDESWSDLTQAQLPQSFDEVAKRQGAGDPLALFAWLKAAEVHLRDLQCGYVGGPPMQQQDGTMTTPDRLTDESRKVAQDSADEYYAKVLEGVKADKDNAALAPYALNALFGRAAIAESRGDLPSARTYLETAKGVAATPYPKIAEQAQSRIETIDRLAVAVVLPSKASLPTKAEVTPFSANEITELMKSLEPPPPAPAPAPPPLLQQPTTTPGGR